MGGWQNPSLRTLAGRFPLAVAAGLLLVRAAGVLWDFLGGYKKATDFPIFWYAYQYLHNKAFADGGTVLPDLRNRGRVPFLRKGRRWT